MNPFLGAELNEAGGRSTLDERGFAEAAWRRRVYCGICDTSGCLNKGTVEYGPDEWYCERCDHANNGRC